MGVHIDASEVERLGVDLSAAPERVQREARNVMKRSALEVKRGMQDDFSGHRYAGGVPASLEFEPMDGTGLAYKVGELDSAGRQWGIAAILAYGTSNNAPNVDHKAALRRETPRILLYLGAAGEDAVLGGAE